MAEKNSAQTNKQTDRQTNRHYENNGHLAVNQKSEYINDINIIHTPSYPICSVLLHGVAKLDTL